MNDIELPLVGVLADMEWTGVRIDVARSGRVHNAVSPLLRAMEERPTGLPGTTFNIASPSGVGEVKPDVCSSTLRPNALKERIFHHRGNPRPQIPRCPPAGRTIPDMADSPKLLTTIRALPAMINPATGKIHTTYNQTVAATGRISSANPIYRIYLSRTDNGHANAARVYN